MTSAPIPATPDLMTLLCLIGRAMRGIGPSNVGMQLLLIGALCPSFGGLLKTWLDVEEHVARAPESDDPWWGLDLDDDEHEVRSGWISRTGPVWRWRQVTRFGSKLVMLVRWFAEQPNPDRLRPEAVWAPGWRLSLPVRSFILLAWPGTCGGLSYLFRYVNGLGASGRRRVTCRLALHRFRRQIQRYGGNRHF